MKQRGFEPGNSWLQSLGPFPGHTGSKRSACESSFETQGRSLVSDGLGVEPLQPACPEGQALGLRVRVRDWPGPNPRHLGPAIWNGDSIAASGRQPGLEITPEGYILIRKLAAVSQSHCRNSTLYFIFSKSTVPSLLRPPSHVLGAPGCCGGHTARVPRETGAFVDISAPHWVKQEMGPQEKKSPVKLST